MKQHNGTAALRNFLDRCIDNLTILAGRYLGGDKTVKQVLAQNSEWYAVQHSPRGDESESEAHTRTYKYTFTGSPESYELHRALVEAGAPGLFDIGYEGRGRGFRMRQGNKFGVLSS